MVAACSPCWGDHFSQLPCSRPLLPAGAWSYKVGWGQMGLLHCPGPGPAMLLGLMQRAEARVHRFCSFLLQVCAWTKLDKALHVNREQGQKANQSHVKSTV